MTQPIRLLADGHPDTGFVSSNLVAESDFTTADKSGLPCQSATTATRRASVGYDLNVASAERWLPVWTEKW